MKIDIEMTGQTQRLLDIDMHYKDGRNNNETGRARRESTVKICARFNMIDPTIVSWLYGISHRMSLEHLNKLVSKDGLLLGINTIRAPKGRVYVLSLKGAKYAEELLCMPISFRKSAEPSRQINQNNIMHDLMNVFCCLKGVHDYDEKGVQTQLWNGMLSEREFRRLHKSNTKTRVVDGLLKEVDETVVACEIEGSFKPKASRQVILLKYLSSLQQGHYQKIFMFSQSKDILKDAKRFHEQLFVDLTMGYDKKTRKPFFSNDDADLLKRSIIYRTKFCDELQSLFYP